MPDWLNPAIEAAGSVASGFLGGLFNANQAKKNRQFQERMYYQQLEDNRKILEDARAYALPSAELQRLKDAHLNPLLYYGQGGAMSQITPAQSASAPHGAQASAQFENPFRGFTANSIAMQKLQAEIDLLKSERDKNEATKNKTEAETDWTQLETKFNREIYDVRKALASGNLMNIQAQTDKLYNDMMNANAITTEQILTLIQSRLYEIKRFDLDKETQGNYVQQGWKSLANDTQRVKQGWRQLALFAQQVTNETNMTAAQVGMLHWSLLKDKAMFGVQFEGLSLDNKLKRWDTHLRKATLTEKQVNTFNGMLKNYYLKTFGQENWPNKLGFKLGDHLKPHLQEIYTLPWQK